MGKNLASVGSHRSLTSCQTPVHHILRSQGKFLAFWPRVLSSWDAEIILLNWFCIACSYRRERNWTLSLLSCYKWPPLSQVGGDNDTWATAGFVKWTLCIYSPGTLSPPSLMANSSVICSSISIVCLKGKDTGRGWLEFSVLSFTICFSVLSWKDTTFYLEKGKKTQVCWRLPVIPAFRRPRQKDHQVLSQSGLHSKAQSRPCPLPHASFFLSIFFEEFVCSWQGLAI